MDNFGWKTLAFLAPGLTGFAIGFTVASVPQWLAMTLVICWFLGLVLAAGLVWRGSVKSKQYGKTVLAGYAVALLVIGILTYIGRRVSEQYGY